MKAHIIKEVTPITLAGNDFGMVFSLKAASELSKRFGGLENMGNIMSDDTRPEQIEDIIFMLFVLLREGAAYTHFVTKEKQTTLTLDEVGTLVSFSNMEVVMQALTESISTNNTREVETEKNPKKAKATQEK